MIDYESLRNRPFAPVEQTYARKDAILYALGLGLGAEPLDPAHLRATYERAEGFCALPSMVNVLAGPGFWAMQPDTGLTWQKILHGEQSFTLHAPLPEAGTLIGRMRIVEIIDKGAGKGALIYSERTLTDKATGALVATVEGTSFARADGGDPETVAIYAVRDIGPPIVATYILMTLLCALVYGFCGMEAFDAFTHAMTTVATGGFANYDLAANPKSRYVRRLARLKAGALLDLDSARKALVPGVARRLRAVVDSKERLAVARDLALGAAFPQGSLVAALDATSPGWKDWIEARQ